MLNQVVSKTLTRPDVHESRTRLGPYQGTRRRALLVAVVTVFTFWSAEASRTQSDAETQRLFNVLVLRVGMTGGEIGAFQAATSVAAELVGVEDQLGSIEAGKLAGLVAVEGDPSTTSGCSRTWGS